MTRASILATPVFLRTECQVNPLGLDLTRPAFSWLVNDSRRGARQSAYQVVVASSAGLLDSVPELWDSGRVQSAETGHIIYSGAPLKAFARAVWKVRIWDADGESGPWSEAARFELGPLVLDHWGNGDLFSPDWNGAMSIRSHVAGTKSEGAPSPYLRRSFHIDGNVLSARLYISAFGLYEASINGQLVSNDIYRPGWTDYDKRLPFQAYDVSTLVLKGENVIGAILGDGWYCGRVSRSRQNWGDRPELIAKLVVEVEGVSEPTVVCTDENWCTATGPILASDNYDGEIYDARLELGAWDQPGFDDSAWSRVEHMGAFERRVQLVATTAPPVRRTAEIRPISVRRRGEGVYQFDLGRNIAGRARITIRAPRGTELTLRFAEVLEDDGTLHTANLATAKATDRYICRGGGEEVYEPRFTFHGFRYVEVSGVPTELSTTDLVGVVLHSDAPRVGAFNCSNELINRLQENIVWSQRANFIDVPTDCPQRSERLGWTGDIQIFARTATFNMDCAMFLTKYVQDLRDSQFVSGVERGTFPVVAPALFRIAGGPAWADAGVIVPWVIWERYGDRGVLEEHFTSVLEYIRFLDRAANREAPGTWLGFGDWLSLDGPLAAEEEVSSEDRSSGIPDPSLLVDRFGGTPRQFLWHAFDAYSTFLAARMADILDRPADAAALRRRWERRREEFAAIFVDESGHLTIRTQTAYVLALHFDLLTDKRQSSIASKDFTELIESVGHLQTGFVGTPYILHVLSDIGRTDLAYRLLERTDYPGWLYPVVQGATTIWERWNAWTQEGGLNRDKMNSFNHYAYGAVGEWLFRVIGGIDTDLQFAGYRRFHIRPQVGGSLSSADASVETIRGRVATSWRLEDDQLHLEVTLPANATGLIRFPARGIADVRENGIELCDVEGITEVVIKDEQVECIALAGSYSFVITDPVKATSPMS
jgi:alpha-L-rhamnosidase